MRIRWKAWLGAATVVLLGWSIVIFVLHQARVGGFRRDDAPQGMKPIDSSVPIELLRRVGYFKNDKTSSFIHFEKGKPRGVTRLCAFGDSFTHGAEVGADLDYPSRLQAHLDRNEPGRFQVLNFGQSWFGFHQSHMMWDDVGRDYDCDVVLLGPKSFYTDRDVSFNHAREKNPYYLHSRYVLDGDDVRRVDVIGDGPKDRFEEYHRLIPHWRYLRYDDAAPAALLALLPSGWTAENPFYYRDDSREEEALATYRILLGRLASEAPRVLLGARLPITSLAPETENVTTFRPLSVRSFPYRAAGNHFGPSGNDLIAQQYAAQAAGRTGGSLVALRTTDLRPPETSPEPIPPPPPLDRYETLSLEVAGRQLGYFTRGLTHLDRRGSPARIREDGTQSLLLVGAPPPRRHTRSEGPLEGCFLPMSKVPEDGATVSVSVAGAEHTIGHVRLWHPEFAIGEIVLGEGPRRLQMRSENDGGLFALPKESRPAGLATPIQISVGDEVLLAGEPNALSSQRGPCYLARANATDLVDPDRLDASGEVDLVGRTAEGTAARVPIARWKKVSVPLPR